MINGIEYWAIANVLDKQSKSLEKTDSNVMSNSDRARRASEILNVNKCPNYLLPKLVCKNQKIEQFTSSNASQKDSIKIGNKNKLSKLNYTDDFILLSEFSEIEGPKPLLTIPIDGGTDFNKNEYSLHLMCVDFHSNLQQQMPSNRECTGEQTNNRSQNETKFGLTSDTSIINYWDSNSTVSSCICHFTLYDLDARGFVRPFCLAYISYDHEKPIKLFEEIRQSFSEVTSLFKKSNLNLFKNELQQMYTDLKYTQELFIKWSSRIKIDINNQDEQLDRECLLDLLALAKEYNLDAKTFHKLNQACKNADNKHLQMSTIENTIREIEQILNIVVNELKEKNWLNKSCLNGQLSSDQFLSNTIDNGMDLNLQKHRSFTYPLTIEIDSNHASSNKNESMNNRNSNFSHYLKRPKIVKHVLVANIGHLKIDPALDELLKELNENLDEQSAKSASTTSTNKPFHHNKVMKTLKELCVDTEKQAIRKLVQMQKYYSIPYYLIKFNESTQAKSKSMKLTKNKSRFNIGKKLFWSMTMGDCEIADFSKHIDIADHKKSTPIRMKNFETNEQHFYADLKPKNMFMCKKEENSLSVVDNDNEMNKLSYDQSVSTQFYSPENTEQRIGTTRANDSKSTTTGQSLIYGTAVSLINCSLENEEQTKINQLETSTSLLVLNDTVNQTVHRKILDSNRPSIDLLANSNEQQNCEDVEDELNNEEDDDDDDNDDGMTGFYSDIATNEQTSLGKNSINILNDEFASPMCYDDFVNSNRKTEVKNRTATNEKDDLLNLNEQDIEYDFADSLLSNLNEQRLSSLSAMTMASVSWNSNYLNKKYELNNRNKCNKKLIDSLVEISEFNFEETLKKLVNRPYFTNLLYSLLKGRPVICLSRYCDELDQLNRIVYCLSNFVPNSFHCLNKITCKQLNKCLERSKLNNASSNSTADSSEQTSPKYTSSPLNINEQSGFKQNELPKLYEIFERKPIKLNDLKHCKLFGLNLLFARNECCSFECNENLSNSNPNHMIHRHKHFHLSKHQQDDDSEMLLKYIPISIRNYVSILDLDKNKFIGPMYKGDYLTQCVQKCKSFKQDSICFMYIITNPVYFYVKMAFLYNYSKSFDEFCISFQTARKKNSLTVSSGSSVGLSSSSNTQHDDRQRKLFLKNDEQRLSTKYYSINENESNTETHSIHSQTSSSSTTTLATQLNEMMNLDECDLKIIIYLLRTLKIKQLYLYNLALHKKQMKKLFKETNTLNRGKSSSKTTVPLVKISTENDVISSSMPTKPIDHLNVYFNTTIQLPLLIDYEEVSTS